MKRNLFTIGTFCLVCGIIVSLVSQITIRADAVGAREGVRIMAGMFAFGLFLIVISLMCFTAAISKRK